MGTYSQAYDRSLTDPDGFWGVAAEAVTWSRPPSVVLDDSAAPMYRWFPDGRLNTCFNALDRHVQAGRGAQLALLHVSPVTGTQRGYSYPGPTSWRGRSSPTCVPGSGRWPRSRKSWSFLPCPRLARARSCAWHG